MMKREERFTIGWAMAANAREGREVVPERALRLAREAMFSTVVPGSEAR